LGKPHHFYREVHQSVFWLSFLTAVEVRYVHLQLKALKRMLFFRKIILGLFFLFILSYNAVAQCSICTKTAQQLGKDSAEGLNFGILYLMLLPFAVAGFIGYRWWKNEQLTASDGEK
jgi:hypothetical protein